MQEIAALRRAELGIPEKICANKDVIEMLAALCHEQWMLWSKKLVESGEKISDERLARWRKLYASYEELPDWSKDYYRDFARKALKIVRCFLGAE